MPGLRCLLVLGFLTFGAESAFCEEKPYPADTKSAAEGSATAKLKLGREQSTRKTVRPRIGAGYVPYSYPALDACPCGHNHCFDAARYYFGGERYRDRWFGKWLRAHFAGGSMLEGISRGCLFPTRGRAYHRQPRAEERTRSITLPGK